MPAPRPLRAALLLAALGSSVATSSVVEPLPHSGQVALHNGAEDALRVEVREADSGLALDCELLESWPDLMADVPLQEAVSRWIEPGGIWPIGVPESASACRLVHVAVEGLGERFVFWRVDGRAWVSWPEIVEDPAAAQGALVSVRPGVAEPFRTAHERLVWAVGGGFPRCASEPVELGWGGPVGPLAVRKRLEGDCPAFAVETGRGEGVLDVCVPPSMIPFEAGDRVDWADDGSNARAVSAGGQLLLASGDSSPWGLELAPDLGAGCLVESACGPELVPAFVALDLDGDPLALEPGLPAELRYGDRGARLVVTGGRRAVASACGLEVSPIAAGILLPRR